MVVEPVESRQSKKNAFTLIELLVVISIIALLMAILMPVLAQAKKQCRATICRSNIRQLFIANSGYAVVNDGFYVRAAYDIFTGFGGKHRWHGVRQSNGASSNPRLNTFDSTKGPLKAYLQDGQVKQCPAKAKYIKEGVNAFEAGCGGYGYNSVGVGSRTYQYGWCSKAMRSSMRMAEIERPAEKIMFTDTAFAKGFPPSYIIEYSFCEPPMWVVNFGDGIQEMPRPQPSIHFRHLGNTTVVWCDGHVTNEGLDFPEKAKSQNEMFQIGWFGPTDNALFRPN